MMYVVEHKSRVIIIALAIAVALTAGPFLVVGSWLSSEQVWAAIWFVGGSSLIIWVVRFLVLSADTTWIRLWVAVRLLLGAVTTLAVTWQLGSDFLPDARMYALVSKGLANVWQSGQVTLPWEYLSSYAFGYFAFTAVHHTLVPGHFFVVSTNIMLGTLGTVLVYRIALELGGRKVARLATVLALVDPVGVVFCSNNIKEAVALFLTMTFIFCAVKMVVGGRWAWLVGCALSATMMITIRPYLIPFWTLLLVPAIISVPPKNSQRAVVALVVLGGVGAVGLALWWIISAAVMAVSSGSFGDFLALVQTAMSGQNSRAVNQDGGVFGTVRLDSLSSVIRFLPVGLVRLFLSPLPWKAANSWYALVVPGVILRYAVWPYFFIGIWVSVRNASRSRLLVAGLLAGTLSIYAIIALGGSVRHITQIAPLTMAVAAMGLSYSREYWMAAVGGYLVLALVIMLAATGLKAGLFYFLPAIGLAVLIVVAYWFFFHRPDMLSGDG